MARETSVDQTPEYDEFIERLRVFHEQRGTPFDPSPKVGNRRVDLLRLYERVVSDGGYDVVSDTKSTKLAWRTIGTEFHLSTSNLPALAFSLKTVYYRYLAAYEIVNVHKKEPPPKEILEEVSAKRGNLLGRTLENYTRPISRDERFLNGGDPDGSDEEGQATPKVDHVDLEEPSSTGRRGLRQAPPQRVLFQPDNSSSRPTRQPSTIQNSPTPSGNLYNGMNGYNAAYAHNGTSQSLASYEPKQQFPLTLRPVTTPSNNPEAFKILQTAHKDAIAAKYGRSSQAKNMILPGTGFTGINIYVRTLLALQSGVQEEQEYALHHLVKISHERGDKYRFDQFAGLAEALIEKVLEISSLFSDVEWKVIYDYNALDSRPQVLDGLNGTKDILDRIRMAKPLKAHDSMHPESIQRCMTSINEAGLVIRNMTMLEENVEYLARFPPFKDTLTILLNLPNDPLFVEIRQYGFEMTEQMARFYPATAEDPLLQSLKDALVSTDRAIILSSLRAISRMGIQLDHVTPLNHIPTSVINRVSEWLLIEDQELRGACLDFLYRYTAVVENVDSLLENADIESLVRQIVRILLHGARPIEEKQEPPPKVVPPPKPPPPVEDAPIPRISVDLIEQLLGYDEPERSSQWLRTCFEEDPAGEITQIALWQAYQIPFAPYGAQRPLLPAKDFITNVSTTFTHASAQVINGPTPRFVIKGIRARAVPVDPRGRAYMRCQWHLDNGQECGDFALLPKHMWEHVVHSHLNLTKGVDGLYTFTPRDSRLYSCRWAGCQHFTTASEAVSPFMVGMHVKTHLPDSTPLAYHRSKHNVTITADDEQSTTTPLPPTNGTLPTQHATPASNDLPYPTTHWPYYNTATDERHDAAGLPLTSALVLRNLARNIPKTDAAHSTTANDDGTTNRNGADELLWRVFAPVRSQLYYVMAYNQPLREYLVGVVRGVGGVGGGVEENGKSGADGLSGLDGGEEMDMVS